MVFKDTCFLTSTRDYFHTVYVKLLVLRSHCFPFLKSYIIHTGRILNQLVRNPESQTLCAVPHVLIIYNNYNNSSNNNNSESTRALTGFSTAVLKGDFGTPAPTQPAFWHSSIPCNTSGQPAVTETYRPQVFVHPRHEPSSKIGRRQDRRLNTSWRSGTSPGFTADSLGAPPPKAQVVITSD